MSEAFAVRKTDNKNTENKTWGCFRATKAYKVVGGTAPDGRCFSMVLDLKNKKRTHTKRRTRELKEIITFSNVVENQADEYNILIQLQFFVVASNKHGVNHTQGIKQNTQTQQK